VIGKEAVLAILCCKAKSEFILPSLDCIVLKIFCIRPLKSHCVHESVCHILMVLYV